MPVHVTPPLVYDGVTVMVATTGAPVALVAMKDAIFPVPLAAKPIDVVLFVQLNTVPATALLRLIGVIAEPEQIV